MSVVASATSARSRRLTLMDKHRMGTLTDVERAELHRLLKSMFTYNESIAGYTCPQCGKALAIRWPDHAAVCVDVHADDRDAGGCGLVLPVSATS